MTTSSPLIIDSQVHAYEHNHPARPWVGNLAGPPHVTGDEMVAAMDRLGVAGALLVSPWSLYRYDASYALLVHARHPSRFGLIKPFDHQDPAVGDLVAEWAKTPGAVGARIMLWGQVVPPADDPGINAILKAAATQALPVNVLCWGKLALMSELAARHPQTQLVVDHLGLAQPFAPPAPDLPFADLDDVLKLAAHDNVAIKISGAGTLSHEPYPYPDLWPHLSRIFETFGLERCLWGSDWTRAVALLNYQQAVDAFRLASQLSEAERGLLMGGSLQSIYGWAPEVTPATTAP